MASRKIKANMRKCRPPSQMWLVVSVLLTALTFFLSLGAVLMDNWFEIYCETDYIKTTLSPSYSFGLWNYCGRDVSWITNQTTASSHIPNWECVNLESLLTGDIKPTWLQGSRSMHVSGCIASGLTFLLMAIHCFSPEDLAQSGSTGFMGASLASAAFFTCTLLSVFGVQHHGYSLVPVECGVPYMPSSYPITFIIASLSMSVLTSLVTGVVSEGLVSDKPVRRGARIVREVET